ncbi:hypothetical protein NHX12_034426 [Muraenolepis orangiensis]|uniref:Bone morphogenetic protein 3 n=1 Tax=Muraenolepis orangiensis TaxID=630683 RepID=A0A9Q0D6M6_9TELE|nr:hypothetical protein NHX12_034426 [Muraenolepis orangiensis]
MAISSRLAVLLLYGWSSLCVGDCAMLKDHLANMESNKDHLAAKTSNMKSNKDHLAAKTTNMKSNKDADREALLPQLRDPMSEHMQMLYDESSRAGAPSEGNTVRSFKAHWGTVNQKKLHLFNLTSLTRSEAVLSATLHFYLGAPPPRGVPRGPVQDHVQLAVWTFASVDNRTRTVGHFLVNVSVPSGDGVSWRWKDVTRAVDRAERHRRLLVGVRVTSRGGGPRQTLLPERPPYMLVYAHDSAISEPESAVSALRRRHTAPGQAAGLAPGFHKLGLNNNNNTVEGRRKRSADPALLPLQNNELPGPEYPFKNPGWDRPGPYDPPDPKADRRQPRKKTRKNQKNKTPLLQFDEHTIKKARKKQWVEPRNCARRYLKVDFADIGWSEWIISPKSFDAFFCSGSCQFPMPKGLKPSNHATIQSIVRAVGVVPGVPEPCCVPEKMSPLSILFFDQDKNVVLKVYPNMSVDSCACR